MLSRAAATIVAAAALVACTESSSTPLGAPIEVESAIDVVREGQPVLRIGAVVDRTSPTAERDNRLLDRFREATALIDGDHALQLEVATIDESSDIPSALDLLTETGVTVLLTTCDTTNVPAIAEAAADRSLLTVTGCASLPQPPIDRTPLFADLANLDHVDDAMAIQARQEDALTAAVLSSDLVRDVDAVCTGFADEFERRGGEVLERQTFTSLLDPIDEVAAATAEPFATVDTIAVCALPGTVGPLVDELRAQGLEQPIVLPWFADEERWSESSGTLRIVVPASPYGDDPDALVGRFVEDAPATDAVLLDTVGVLTEAADATGSVGSRRLHDALVDQEWEAPTGSLRLDRDTGRTETRTYRLVELTDGDADFSRSIPVG